MVGHFGLPVGFWCWPGSPLPYALEGYWHPEVEEGFGWRVLRDWQEVKPIFSLGKVRDFDWSFDFFYWHNVSKEHY